MITLELTTIEAQALAGAIDRQLDHLNDYQECYNEELHKGKIETLNFLYIELEKQIEQQ